MGAWPAWKVPISTTGDGFRISGRERPGLPVIYCPDGTVFVPATAYLYYSAEMDRVAESALRKEAYTIREWFGFLSARGVRWDRPTDRLLGAWCKALTSRYPNPMSAPGQVEVKASRVFRFYRDLPKALPFDRDGRPRSLLVHVPGTSGAGAPLTSKFVTVGGADRIVWSGSRRVQPAPAKRHTSDASEVRKVLERLRSKHEDRRPGEPRGTRTLSLRRAETDRNWLLARCKSEAGLRDVEISTLAIGAIEHALRSEGLLSRNSPGLVQIAYDPGAQERILDDLDRKESLESRDNLYILVDGKGGKSRLARFPIGLVRTILQRVVWSARRDLVARWRRREDDYEPPGCVFLSPKTGRDLRPGSIGDLLAAAYEEAKVAGSGHRLRAYYCTAAAARIWTEACSFAGGVFTPEAERVALDLIAEELGHSRVTRTTRSYLSAALAFQFAIQGSARFELLQVMMRTILRPDLELSEAKVRLLARVFNAIATSPDRSDQVEAIKRALVR